MNINRVFRAAPPAIRSNRGELMLIAGNAFHVERELQKLETNGQLLSAVYTRRGQRQIIAHAEVI